ncbi:hypothetical protein EW146_g591 [Bondarzewia mesenterica]|uniref:Uncharacterized protein n=1 Tax=Bondarzewia mesenterica TaxID=1095465 RepID=A0A4S4M6R1_9AGAM|nr:hypothetical protein EW146_g591 [Bondarzewia mesenterica]
MVEDHTPSAASTTGLSKSQTVRSKLAPAAPIKTVITTPPWAKDEPPSPTDADLSPSPGGSRTPSEARRSDVHSLNSTSLAPADEHQRWWAFTRHTPQPTSSTTEGPSAMSERKGASSVRAKSTWMSPSNHASGSQDEAPPAVPNNTPEPPSRMKDWGLHLSMPTPPVAPSTLAQSRTPGWDTPWAPRPQEAPGRGWYERLGKIHHAEARDDHDQGDNLSPWARRKKRARAYLLSNAYVPLLFRFINITFTTAALALAIRIRLLEKSHSVRGALGSSPTLILIFAPLTLVHVMVAIYLEYFGRPLGLWRTSGKLAHTLLEVLFICAWSAALSLCFDNFFTSIIPCASHGAISWYSSIPRPASPFGDLGRHEGGVGDSLCDDQLALICLVAIGLLMYCFNLVISLYRIFEKVKYQSTMV